MCVCGSHNDSVACVCGTVTSNGVCMGDGVQYIYSTMMNAMVEYVYGRGRCL